MLLTVLFIVGITAEAITGALAAGRERMDLFGVVMVASVTAIGGGSIRDVLLNHHPLTWVGQPLYLLLVVVAAVLTVSIASLMRYFKTLFLVLDALGLVVFAILGTRIALEMGHGLIVAAASGIITGVFGGVMRDLLCNRVPLVFRKELYASIALLATLIYYTLDYVGMAELATILITLSVGFTLRLLAIYLKLSLPVFDYQAIEHRPLNRRFRRRHPWARRMDTSPTDDLGD